jgi:hypothetical protein
LVKLIRKINPDIIQTWMYHSDFIGGLAAKIAGTKISLINLIDTYTQWTVANFGLPIEQMGRDESVCQYTILNNESFEVKSLSSDDRFKDKFYVVDNPNLEYYLAFLWQLPMVTI